MRISFHTLGCKVNQYETEAMSEEFEAAGHTTVNEEEEADVYVVNTCTVTNLASRKSRQFIRRMKAQNPESIMVVTGCYAQIDPEKVAEIEGVNIICGTNERKDIVKRVENYAAARESEKTAAERDQSADDRLKEERPAPVERHILPYEELNEYVSSGIITGASERTRAFIKIQEGCNRFCSYCIIPYARGPVRSRGSDEVICEAERLIGNGYKEIVLTGINTALYGGETEEDLPLKDLLKKINAIKGDFRIRLSSLEPAVVNAEQVKSLLDIDKLCHHLHLSAQSGSDKVLHAMNRPYTKTDYLDIVKVLKDKDPCYGISTDIIAGFPGESEEDLAESLDLIERAGFCRVHPFNYSVRPGTAAERMDGHIPPAVRKKRTEKLMEAGEKAAERFCSSMAGKTRRVLTEELTQDGEHITGYTDNYVKVFIPAKGLKTNEFYDVLLTEVVEGGMNGVVDRQ